MGKNNEDPCEICVFADPIDDDGVLIIIIYNIYL